jgi:hypothetical protein
MNGNKNVTTLFLINDEWINLVASWIFSKIYQAKLKFKVNLYEKIAYKTLRTRWQKGRLMLKIVVTYS